jgi:enterochelin esterase-like enzyme
MQFNVSEIKKEKVVLKSAYLEREVQVDIYATSPLIQGQKSLSLLLINDGQNLDEMNFSSMLERLTMEGKIGPVICLGIHADKNRKREYGVAGIPDYLGRGDKASLYTSFMMKELVPFIEDQSGNFRFDERVIAGFSLGGLMALDIAWNNSEFFNKVGVFSGSLWWRSVGQDDEIYDDDRHRIIHQRIRLDNQQAGLKFFFQCGNMDETMDRNKNGIIDSIDDTQDLIKELTGKGYDINADIHYLEMPDGRHDIATWARAMEVFLQWALPVSNKV